MNSEYLNIQKLVIHWVLSILDTISTVGRSMGGAAAVTD